MGYQDRPYYRDKPAGGGFGGALNWIVSGSLPLFTAFDIRVRAHASMVLFIGLTLIFGLGHGSTVQDRITSMAVLFGIVLLHEFGHCFAARSVGGHAEDILMTPIGGLAFAHPPRRPWPTFVTVAGGPLVNVVICLVCGVALWFLIGAPSFLNPFSPLPPARLTYDSPAFYLWWIFIVSYLLLLFNLLPIFPLDGGQLLQSILWPHVGYYRSMNFACITGMIGSGVLAVLGLVSSLLLVFIAIMGFMTCLNTRRALLAAGPYATFEDSTDYSAAYEKQQRSQRKENARAARRAEKARAAEQAEQAQIDAILAKVSAHGMQSLTGSEKRTLSRATERQRQVESARAKRVR